MNRTCRCFCLSRECRSRRSFALDARAPALRDRQNRPGRFLSWPSTTSA